MFKSILNSYFVNLDNLENIFIHRRTLRTLLENVGWSNTLIIREHVYLNLVRVFYSNIDIYAGTESWVITNVSRIPSELDGMNLNEIIGTRDGGYNAYTSRSKLDFLWYSHTRAVINIYRCSDFFDKDCNGTLKSQALCLRVWILYNAL